MVAKITKSKDFGMAPIEATFVEEDVVVIDRFSNKRTIPCAFQLTFDEALDFFSSGQNLATFAATFADGPPDETALTLNLYRTAIRFISDLLCFAYGKFDEDGLSFIKNQEIYDFFKGSVMLKELIRRILNDEGFFEEFKNNLLPPEFMERVNEEKDNPSSNVIEMKNSD